MINEYDGTEYEKRPTRINPGRSLSFLFPLLNPEICRNQTLHTVRHMPAGGIGSRRRYSKRKTRVLSIIFRCRFFERTSHIVDICCAQRGVPPLAARPSPEKFFIVSMIIAMRKRITPSRTMLCACILKAATCWRCRLTNTSNGHEV